jgi:hypothetical protein
MTYEASSESRKAMTFATSAAVPKRRPRTAAANTSNVSRAQNAQHRMSTEPEAMPFTLIPWAANSLATVSVVDTAELGTPGAYFVGSGAVSRRPTQSRRGERRPAAATAGHAPRGVTTARTRSPFRQAGWPVRASSRVIANLASRRYDTAAKTTATVSFESAPLRFPAMINGGTSSATATTPKPTGPPPRRLDGPTSTPAPVG